MYKENKESHGKWHACMHARGKTALALQQDMPGCVYQALQV
jgi:hypothetical protein